MADDDVFPVPASRPRRSLSTSEDPSSFMWNEGGSQEPSQTQTEILTQNVDLTQLGEFDEDENLSNFQPLSPPSEEKLPWARLLPCKDGIQAVDLMTKCPEKRLNDKENGSDTTTEGAALLDMDNLHPSDIFNEYSVGRSNKCHILANKPPKELSKSTKAMCDWAYGMISNTHCRIYCAIDVATNGMQTFVEDCSGNGTLINKTTILRRGEKRLLHSGDEICLLNPQMLRKKIKSKSHIQDLMEQHSYIFVLQQHAIWTQKDTRRASAVNARNVKSHSILDDGNNQPRTNSPTPTLQRTGLNIGRKRTMSSEQRRVSPRRVPKPRIQEEYDIRDLLGSGTVGEVRRAIHRQTGAEHAVKIITIGGRNRANYVLESSATFEAEAAILRELQHPYIVNLIDVFVAPQAIYLVMELLHGGDLFDRIVQKEKYPEVESRRVMRRLLSAVFYLHEERNIVHRDIKPENILLVNKESDVEIKLTDFGLAKAVNGEEGLKTFCGTPQYFAPEVLRRRHTVAGRGRYGKQADMWSIGVVLYVILSGMPPFDVNEGFDAVADAKIEFPDEFWFGVSQEARDLVKSLLVADPRKRMTVQEACQHPWILVDDGDTHVHPLDDPKLGCTKKTLFQAAMKCSLGAKPKLPNLSSLNSISEPILPKPTPRQGRLLLSLVSSQDPVDTDASSKLRIGKLSEPHRHLQDDPLLAKNIVEIGSKRGASHQDSPNLRLRLSFENPVTQKESMDHTNEFQGKNFASDVKSGADAVLEDEILSSFSEKSESIESFSTFDTFPMENAPDENEPANSVGVTRWAPVCLADASPEKTRSNGRRITDSIGTTLPHTRNLPSISKTTGSTPKQETKKRKPQTSRTIVAKKRGAKAQPVEKSNPPGTGNQPKISSWFQKVN